MGGPLREKRLRRFARRRRADARRRSLSDAQGREQGFQDRKAHPLLPPLLAYGQTGALLPARLLVHPNYGAARPDDRTQQDDPLEAGIDRNGTLRQVARRSGGLEPLALALLGHAAADLGYGGLLGNEVHRLGRRARRRNRKIRRGKSDEGESLQELQAGRPLQRELLDRPDRPAPSLRGQYRAGFVQRRTDAARTGSDRRVVRLGRHALCPATLPLRARRRLLQERLSGRFHRRRRRSDARMVLHAARHRHDALRLGSFQEHHFERPGARQERQQNVQTPGQCRGSLRNTFDLRRRRDALVHDLQLAALGQPQVRPGRRGRSAPQVLRHALQYLLVLRPLRQCGRFYGTGAGSSDERTPGDRPLDHLPAQYAGPERHRIARELRSDAGGPYDPGIRMRKPVELVRAPQPQAVLGRRSDTRQTGGLPDALHLSGNRFDALRTVRAVHLRPYLPRSERRKRSPHGRVGTSFDLPRLRLLAHRR